MVTHPRARSRVSTFSALVYVRTHHTSVLHLINALLRENNGVFASEDDVILSGVIFVLSDPVLFELFQCLGVLRLDMVDPLCRGQLQQELAMIRQLSHHVLLLLYFAPNVNDLLLKLLFRTFHDFALSLSPIGFPLFIVR